ncbi:MAG: cobalamin-dependent protein [Melioribacteraceae bacterium]|nr:cobalamin-dependent protein [Melioribacteraceae bacterium]
MISDAIYYHYLNALLEGNKAECTKIISELIDNNVDIKEIYTKLFQKSMYRIGYLWEHDRASVAKEHQATKITESLLNLNYEKILDTPKINKKVVIACIDKEFHEIGARIVSDFFELSGWQSIFLGSNTPQNEIVQIIEEEKPDVVGISNTFYINVARLIKLTEKIREKFSDQEIIVGGQALNEETASTLNNFGKIFYIPTLDVLEKFIKERS